MVRIVMDGAGDMLLLMADKVSIIHFGGCQFRAWRRGCGGLSGSRRVSVGCSIN
jgi:hypothetical protein